jgi:hypothetical protein
MTRQTHPDIKKAIDERRWIMVSFDPDEILSVLQAISGDPCRLHVRTNWKWPEGCFVSDVHNDFRNRYFIARVYHPSFAPIPDGSEYRMIDLATSYEAVHLEVVRVETDKVESERSSARREFL